MLEKDFEDIICKYPELIEEGLIYISNLTFKVEERMFYSKTRQAQKKLIIEF